MMHKYYTLRRPPMPGSIPSGAVETGELSERIRINGLGTAWGYACYDHELTVGEMADYELAYWETVEASETAPAPVEAESSEDTEHIQITMLTWDLIEQVEAVTGRLEYTEQINRAVEHCFYVACIGTERAKQFQNFVRVLGVEINFHTVTGDSEICEVLRGILEALIPAAPTDPTGAAPTETVPAPAPVEVSEIAPDHITAAGVEMPAEYRTSSTGRSITAFVAMDGERFRVVFSGVCGELFTACKRATKGETVTVDGDDLMIVLGTAAQVKEKAPREVNPDKERHGEVPEKWFVGQALEGKSWRIVFDGDAGKTRVIFPRKPSAKVLEAVKAAGFYWSPSMQSWNKGLTWKAYRAAEKLHAELHKLAA